MTIDDCFYLGFVKKTHGLDGELQFFLDADTPRQYKKLESVLLEIKGQLIPFFIESLEIKPSFTVVRLKNVRNAGDAEKLIGAALYLPLEMLPPLKGKKQFYYHEIIGYTMRDEEFGEVGKVTDVLDYPNQAVFSVQHPKGEVLIPVNDEIILSVDKENRVVHVKSPEGLIGLYLGE